MSTAIPAARGEIGQPSRARRRGCVVWLDVLHFWRIGRCQAKGAAGDVIVPAADPKPDAQKFQPALAIELIDQNSLLVRERSCQATTILRYLEANDDFEMQILDLEAAVDASGLLQIRLDYSSRYEGPDIRTGSCLMSYRGNFTVWWDG
jgi:hypothetical protein